MNHQTLTERSLRPVGHPYTQMKRHETQPLVPIVRAEDQWGHSPAHSKAALVDPLDWFDPVMLAGFTHPPVVELSQRLGALAKPLH